VAHTDDEPDEAAALSSMALSETFEATFVREYPKMVAIAAAVSGSRADAEDIAQEALSRLHRRWFQVRGFDKPGAWLRRITINLALSRRRRLASEARAVLRLSSRSTSVTLPETRADDEHVWHLVAGLPPRQRAAIALHYLEDRPIDEIAEILDISPSTARVHLHRARETLGRQLDAGGAATGNGSAPGSTIETREAR
jgi:RNA polymerase sigma-70 factor (ECF subfamily)